MPRIAAWLLLLAAIAIVAAEGEIFEEVKALPIETAYIDGSPGAQSGSLVKCARFLLPGDSRLRNVGRAANVVRVTVTANAQHSLLQFHAPKIQVCFHGNSSMEICQCEKDSWESLDKGKWSGSKSPFQSQYVDVRATGSISDIPVLVSVSSREDFCLYRVVFFVLGVALLVLAPVVSSWVPFYYSSAMTMGIFLVVLILLYQGMRLLPTGRKSTMYIFMYGSMIGLGTVLIRHVVGMLKPIMMQLGLGEDMLKPFALFALLGIVLVGAYMGHWGVQKFVLTPRGRVDSATAQFVKWALRVFAVALLLQSSKDPLFGLAALAFGWLMAMVQYISLPALEDVSWSLPWFRRSPSGDWWEKFYRRRQSKLWRKRHSSLYTPIDRPSTSSPGRQSFGSGKRVFSPEENFYSTYHYSPEKKRMSRAKYDALSRECTQMCMEDLVTSPEFAKWADDNAARINVLPQEFRDF